MSIKNTAIIIVGVVGIITVISGILIAPSPKELYECEGKLTIYGPQTTYGQFKENENYNKQIEKYNELKMMETLSNQLLYLGISVVLFSITLAILSLIRGEEKDEHKVRGSR